MASAILHGHSLVVACENAPCCARRTRTRAYDVHSPEQRDDALLKPSPAAQFNEADAALAEGRADPKASSCAGNALRRKCTNSIIGADWFSLRGGTCRLHGIHINQPCMWVGKVGETVKQAAPNKNSQS
jgi:hypothetical protein